MKYISEQITKAEREGWFDKVNYPNATACMELLKSIRTYCDNRLAAKDSDTEIDKEYPWPESPDQTEQE